MSKRTKAEIRAERDALLAAVEKAGKRGKPFRGENRGRWKKTPGSPPRQPEPKIFVLAHTQVQLETFIRNQRLDRRNVIRISRMNAGPCVCGIHRCTIYKLPGWDTEWRGIDLLEFSHRCRLQQIITKHLSEDVVLGKEPFEPQQP